MTMRRAKRYQNSAALLIFMRRTTISHFAFLISNFSFEQRFHPQSMGGTPKGLTLNSEPAPLYPISSHFPPCEK